MHQIVKALHFINRYNAFYSLYANEVAKKTVKETLQRNESKVVSTGYLSTVIEYKFTADNRVIYKNCGLKVWLGFLHILTWEMAISFISGIF